MSVSPETAVTGEGSVTLEGLASTTVTPLSEYWQYRLYKFLFLYASPCVLVVGLFGNVFAFAVLQNRRMRTSAASFLLSALAVSDTGCLLTELVNNWVKELTGYRVDIRSYNIHTCRLHVFLTFLFHHLSPITLMFLTVQRVICVYLPIKAKIIASRGNVIKMWLVVAAIITAFDCMAFFTMTYNTRTAILNKQCFYNDDVIDVFNTIDSVLESYLPCSVIVLGNILIILKVNRASLKRLSFMSSVNATSTKEEDNTTAMLVVVTTAFVLLTAPFYVWVHGIALWSPRSDDRLVRAQTALAYAITYHLLEANFATNFLLYCLFGRRFRSAVRDMMGRGEAGGPGVQMASTRRSSMKDDPLPSICTG